MFFVFHHFTKIVFGQNEFYLFVSTDEKDQWVQITYTEEVCTLQFILDKHLNSMFPLSAFKLSEMLNVQLTPQGMFR